MSAAPGALYKAVYRSVFGAAGRRANRIADSVMTGESPTPRADRNADSAMTGASPTPRAPTSGAAIPVLIVAAMLLQACALAPVETRDDSAWLPRIGAAPDVVSQTSEAELRRLNLVATNLVSVLVQLPEVRPASTTLQVSRPVSAFGNVLIRALEDAGYGVQQVSADQGQNYTTYSKRFAETEAGPLNDYQLSINAIQVRREFVEIDELIFPSSLMIIEGSAVADSLVIDDNPFREQGGAETTFISGVRSADGSLVSAGIDELQVRVSDTLPATTRTEGSQIMSMARQRFLSADEGSVDRRLAGLERLRRTVLIFEDARTLVLGVGNKQAIRLLTRDVRADDVFQITACTDADGSNPAADARGARVGEELLSYGIPETAIYLSPCLRASFRHPSDNSPVPVEIVQHRVTSR